MYVNKKKDSVYYLLVFILKWTMEFLLGSSLSSSRSTAESFPSKYFDITFTTSVDVALELSPVSFNSEVIFYNKI